MINYLASGPFLCSKKSLKISIFRYTLPCFVFKEGFLNDKSSLDCWFGCLAYWLGGIMDILVDY